MVREALSILLKISSMNNYVLAGWLDIRFRTCGISEEFKGEVTQNEMSDRPRSDRRTEDVKASDIASLKRRSAFGDLVQRPSAGKSILFFLCFNKLGQT